MGFVSASVHYTGQERTTELCVTSEFRTLYSYLMVPLAGLRATAVKLDIPSLVLFILRRNEEQYSLQISPNKLHLLNTVWLFCILSDYNTEILLALFLSLTLLNSLWL